MVGGGKGWGRPEILSDGRQEGRKEGRKGVEEERKAGGRSLSCCRWVFRCRVGHTARRNAGETTPLLSRNLLGLPSHKVYRATCG